MCFECLLLNVEHFLSLSKLNFELCCLLWFGYSFAFLPCVLHATFRFPALCITLLLCGLIIVKVAVCFSVCVCSAICVSLCQKLLPYLVCWRVPPQCSNLSVLIPLSPPQWSPQPRTTSLCPKQVSDLCFPLFSSLCRTVSLF